MQRIPLIVGIAVIHLSAMFLILGNMSSPALAFSGERVANGEAGAFELEMPEMPEMVGVTPPLEGDVEVGQLSANLTNVYTMPNYATVSDLMPRVVVSKGTEALDDGYYFLTPFAANSIGDQYSLIIVNDEAQLVYYKLSPGNRLLDFRRHPDGTLAYHNPEVHGYEVLDNRYSLVKSWTPGNGYADIDTHDLQQLANGNVVFLIYDTRPVDLSAYGGRADAQVIDLVIQEKTQDNSVVFEWNSHNHFAITDTYISLNQAIVDYAHGNAIEEDFDGNFLISNRNMSEITKIDRVSGEIIWRLGGKNNEFTFIDNIVLPGIGGFSFQHDIRRLANGHITLFDNSNQFTDENLRGSRGVEYEIDEVNKTVMLIREFRTIPDTISPFMGNMQRLHNGNTVVGWGGVTIGAWKPPVAISEFTPEGDTALELAFLDEVQVSYRALKFPWQGFPTDSPLLVVPREAITPTLYYSWNGATEVVSYTVYGGQTPLRLDVIAEQDKTDFEDSTSLEGVNGDLCFFQVMPSMKENAEAQPSNRVYVGDAFCNSGLSANITQTVSRPFTYPQSTDSVTTTLTLRPSEFTTPTVFVHTPTLVELASVPTHQIMSDIRFTIEAFEGESYNETLAILGDAQLAIDYGALDLSRRPLDVSLLRWDEAGQHWTSDGFTLVQNDTVGQRLTYALHLTGEFALFVANDAPQAASVALFGDEDESLHFSATQFPYFDPDGDDFAALMVETLPVSGLLTYSGTPLLPSQVITVGALPLLLYTPEADDFGTPYTTFRYTVSDSFTQSVPYTATLAIRPINDAPVATDDQVFATNVSVTLPVETNSALAIPVLANDSDVDGDSLRIVSVTEPAHGTAIILGDEVLYRITDFYDGVDSFAYVIEDGHGGQAIATVFVQRSPNVQYLPRIGSE